MNTEYWDTFNANGLPRGNYRGDKGTYHREHPQSFFLPGARVCNETEVIWTGDLDLASDDASRLMNVATALNATLYVHNEASFGGAPGESPRRFAMAIVTASGIEVTRWGMSYVSDAMRNGQLLVTKTAPEKGQPPRRS